jgi:UDP-N-acetyl-D-mannosaminuronate dehydrogenase
MIDFDVNNATVDMIRSLSHPILAVRSPRSCFAVLAPSVCTAESGTDLSEVASECDVMFICASTGIVMLAGLLQEY